MPVSPYLKSIRSKIGQDLLLVPTVSAAVFDDVGNLLLARHVHGDAWAPVGGIVDLDEEPADAARREVAEETGLNVEVIGLIGAYGGPECRMTYANGDRIAFVATLFACRLISGNTRLQRNEISELGWFSQEAAMLLHRLPWWVCSPDLAPLPAVLLV